MWTYQNNGWMTDETGERWFNQVFLKHCGPERPQLLILDGHSSHESLGILQRAIEEDIQIMALPPHSTHFLQPLDRSVFKPLNYAYDEACGEYLQVNPLNLVTKWSFPGIFTTAWDAGVTIENIKSGSAACGIFPINPDALPSSAFSPSVLSDTPLFTQASTESDVAGQSTSITALSSSVAADDGIPLPPTYQSPDVSVTDSADDIDTSSLTVNDITDTSFVDNPEITMATPSEILDMLASEEFVVESMITPAQQPVELVPQADWNKEVEGMFLPPTQSTSTGGSVKKETSFRKPVTTHRLLTSEDIINEKVKIDEKKQLKQQKSDRCK